MHHHPRYRAHIDGLRAIAVLGVVLFHFGASWLPGGFVGVDVFFVISGFLISKSIYVEVGDRSFSILSFYERRARRIMPAFIAVTLATSVVAFFVLYPGQLYSYASSVIWSSLFAANIYFWLTTDYFAPASEELPLLHYWSLGVEEQFYIFFPVIVMVFLRLLPRALPYLIAALLVASLIACEIAMRSAPETAFYLLPFRAYELLIGCALALPQMRFTGNEKVAAGAVLAGTALIVASMLIITKKMPFPGITAVAPCLGTALVIWGGEQVHTRPAQLLGSLVMRFFGAISYSLYLVHWPIVVFGRMIWPATDPLLFLVAGTSASILLGWLSWLLIEQPPRRQGWKTFLPRPAIFVLTAAGIFAFISNAGMVRMANGFPDRFAGEVQRILAYRDYDYRPTFREGACFLRPEQLPSEIQQGCLPTAKPSVFLWGSSHIAQFFSGVWPQFLKSGYAVGQITASGCLPLVGRDNPVRPNCRAANDFAIDWLVTNKPNIVIMGGDGLYTTDDLAAMAASIKRLTDVGIRVVVVGPVPYFRRPVPTILAERAQKEMHDVRGLDDMLPGPALADALMSKFFRDMPSVTYISFFQKFCPEGQCPMSVNGVPMHFDMVHFTKEASELYGAQIAEAVLKKD